MKKLFIVQHGPSESVKRLKESFREEGIFCKSVKSVNSRYRYRENHLVLNYGSSRPVSYPVLNSPASVAIAANKLKTFNELRLHNFPNVPLFTTNKEEAKDWISDGKVVYCRQILNGSQGVGIIVASSIDQLVDAPLYVLKVPRNIEARVHVFNGEVIDFSVKRKRIDAEVSNEVRNLSNGWVFCRSNESLSSDVLEAAKESVRLIGLDFGAVDLAVNRGIPRVLEINTAPGLEGTTVERYKEAIKKLLEEN